MAIGLHESEFKNPVIRWARGREQRSVDAATLSPAAG